MKQVRHTSACDAKEVWRTFLYNLVLLAIR